VERVDTHEVDKMTVVDLELLKAPPSVDLEIDIRVRTRMAITAFTAQRKVSRLVLERVSNLLCGEEPTLVVGDRVRWRVPVWLGFPKQGLVGKVGEIDVDVETGEILFDQRDLEEISERADDLARRTLSAAA
jgi:hypothetical protein